MIAKEFDGNRKRSRPATKKSKVDFFKKNKIFTIFVIMIVLILALSGIYVVYYANDDNGDLDDPNNGSGTIVNETNPIAVIDTSMGTIKIELYMGKAPITAGNFKDLAESGYYNGVIFHRVIPDFMIQGGDPLGTGTGGHAAKYHEGVGADSDNPDTWAIPDEFDKDLSNVRGTISMANSGPNSGGSQFFINVAGNIYLDYNKYLDQITREIVYEEVPYPQDSSKHSVFGKVIEGMDVVDAISEVDKNISNDKPYTDVVINSITFE